MWSEMGFDIHHAMVGSDQYPIIDGVETSLQSQIVRLYAPKLFPDRVVLTTDIDMLPLDQSYFWSRLARPGQISIYSSDAHKGTRYPMCYLSAYGHTFVNTMLDSPEELWCDFVLRLNGLGLGWNTDELYATDRINRSPFEIIKHHRGFGADGVADNRLDRVDWNVKDIPYIDAHCPRPFSRYKAEITDLKRLMRVAHG
jgi:hypothetical protein